MDKSELHATREQDQKTFREAHRVFKNTSCVWYRHVPPGHLPLTAAWNTLMELQRKGRVEVKLQYPQHPDASPIHDFTWVDTDEEKASANASPVSRLRRTIGSLADGCEEDPSGTRLTPEALNALLDLVEG